MNLLIVDDELYAVRTLQRNIHWDIIGIDRVFAAYNIGQAKKLLEENEINIVVTDIEMPGGSGLELLEWIQDQGYPCKSICMTCHAEFDYAQQAIRYRASDYIVKPLNMKLFSETVSRLVQSIKEESLKKEWQDKGKLWDENREHLESVFWQKMLDGIADEVSEDYREDVLYFLNIFAVRKIEARKDEWDSQQEKMQYLIYHMIQDIFLIPDQAGRCGWKDDYLWAILDNRQTLDLKEKLDNFLEMTRAMTGACMVAYVDRPHYGSELHDCWIKLRQVDRNNVSVTYGVYNADTHTDQVGGIFSDGFRPHLKELLEKRDFAAIRASAAESQQEEISISSAKLMVAADMLKGEVYQFLLKNEIEPETFWTDELMEKGRGIYKSTWDLENWMILAADRLEEITKGQKINEPENMVSAIRQYIRDHVEERFSREDIAESVAFSPDYIARVFKKETGISISEYIMQMKVERAKELIAEGSMNIGDIAVALGYSSFSYFSEVFRRVTGLLPKEYKGRMTEKR